MAPKTRLQFGGDRPTPGKNGKAHLVGGDRVATTNASRLDHAPTNFFLRRMMGHRHHEQKPEDVFRRDLLV